MAERALGTDVDANISTNGRAEPNAEQIVRLVGIGPRLGARLIDTVMIGFLSMLVAVMAGLVGQFLGMFSSNVSGWGAFFTAGAGLIFSLLYYISAWTKTGQTLGDTLLGQKIVRTDGSKLSVGNSIVRYIGYLISAALLSIGFIWIAFDKRRQGWHDKMANTVVIPAEEEFSPGQAVTFVAGDRGSTPVWIGLWVILLLVAPGALTAGLLTLGPFVDMAIKALRGG